MSVFLEIWFSQASVIKIRFAQNGMKKGKNKNHELARIKNNLMQKKEKNVFGKGFEIRGGISSQSETLNFLNFLAEDTPKFP